MKGRAFDEEGPCRRLTPVAVDRVILRRPRTREAGAVPGAAAGSTTRREECPMELCHLLSKRVPSLNPIVDEHLAAQWRDPAPEELSINAVECAQEV